MMQVMLAAVLALTVASGANISCPDHEKCQCDHSVEGDLDISCPRQNNLFHAKLTPEKQLRFVCTTAVTWTDYDLLSGFRAGRTPNVSFMFCPTPNKPLRQFFQTIGISEVETLIFRNTNLSNTLEASFLTGLSNITHLYLDFNGITDLPVKLFQNMTALQQLDLKQNNLQLRRHVFDHVSSLNFLELGGNHMQHIEAGMFKNLTKLRRLYLWGNNLQNLTRDTFSGLESLEFLDLSSNLLFSVPADIFANIPQLVELSMFGNNFSSLPGELFSFTRNLMKLGLYDNRQQLQSVPFGLLANLTDLQEVYLSTCNITSVPNSTFWGSPAIANISLHGNALTTLPSELFRDTTHLKNLNLGHNKLLTLPDGIFSTLVNLRSLNLGHNQLFTISRDLLKDLDQLEWLDLEYNRLLHISVSAFTHVSRLKYLKLSHNQLTLQRPLNFSDGATQSVLNTCTELEELYLSHNNITTMFEDWCFVMVKLQMLDLSHNVISYIELQDLQFLSSYITVDLTFNNISTVDLQLLENVARYQTPNSYSTRRVLLEGNPLVCDCKIYDLLRYMEDRLDPEARSMFELIPGNLTCAAPQEWQGIAVRQLSSLKLMCRIAPVNCPVSCMCYMRPANLALIIDCSNVKLTKVPTSLPDPLTFDRRIVWPKRVKLNHTELLLQRTGIMMLPQKNVPGYNRVTHLYLSHNSISTLGLHQLPAHLEVLELDHNNITHLDTSVLQNLGNTTTGLQRLTLQANPWRCDCGARHMLSFLQQHYTQVPHMSSITCGDNSGRSLANLTISELCPMSSATIIAVSVVVAMLGIAVGVLAALYYYYKHEVKVWLYAHGLCFWFVTEEELDREKLYDAFISYSHRDEDFVVNQLVPELEAGTTPFKLCLHYRDWIAGEWIPNQIARSVDDSRRTLVVLSPSFLESVWGRMEFRTAHSQALSEGRARVIVLLYGDVGPLDQLDPELRAYLSMNTYVKWGDPWFWDKLRYALPHPQKESEKRGMELKSRRTSKDDKLELINPSIPATTTTPPTEIVLNPLEVTNGHATLLTETNGHVNSCFVKSV